jgi:hypothetical protein
VYDPDFTSEDAKALFEFRSDKRLHPARKEDTFQLKVRCSKGVCVDAIVRAVERPKIRAVLDSDKRRFIPRIMDKHKGMVYAEGRFPDELEIVLILVKDLADDIVEITIKCGLTTQIVDWGRNKRNIVLLKESIYEEMKKHIIE